MSKEKVTADTNFGHLSGFLLLRGTMYLSMIAGIYFAVSKVHQDEIKFWEFTALGYGIWILSYFLRPTKKVKAGDDNGIHPKD